MKPWKKKATGKKIFSKYPRGKLQKEVKLRWHYSNKNSEVFSGKADIENGEKHLRQKSWTSWQNVLNSRQITTDIEEKQTNQGEVLCGEESVV